MKNYYLTAEEINKLKSELMYKRSRSFPYYSKRKQNNSRLNSSSSFSYFYKQNRNSEIGHVFEDNIRKTLNVEFNWKKVSWERHFFYRIITVDNKRILIEKDFTEKLIINGRRFKFTLNQDQSLSIHSGNVTRRFISNISEKRKATIIYLNDTKIMVSEVKEIEIDGFFSIHDSNFVDIFGNDLVCLYKNTSDEDLNGAEYVCCEIKLNKSKIKLLINQLLKDKEALEICMGSKKIIYVGFVGKGILNNNILSELNNLSNINLIILEIKNCFWLNRDLTSYIDWTTISELKNLKSEFKNLKSDLKNEREEINNKLNIIMNALGIQSEAHDFIGKKRK